VIFAGIDPGKTGYMFWEDGSTAAASPVAMLAREFNPGGILRLAEDLAERGDVFCAIECQQAMPRQGLSSTLSTGYGYGLWIMALTAAKVPYRPVRASEWKRRLGVLVRAPGLTGAARRRASKALAVQRAKGLFPNVDFRRTPRCRTPCHDMAEAALLSRWARMEYGGKNG